MQTEGSVSGRRRVAGKQTQTPGRIRSLAGECRRGGEKPFEGYLGSVQRVLFTKRRTSRRRRRTRKGRRRRRDVLLFHDERHPQSLNDNDAVIDGGCFEMLNDGEM